MACGELNPLSQAAQEVNDAQVQTAADQLSAAAADALANGSPTGQASAAATQQAAQAVAEAESAIRQSADAVRNMLANNPPAAASQPPTNNSGQPADNAPPASTAPGSPSDSSSGSPSGSPPSALSPQQMAQLLDELDRQLNAGDNLGAQDNNQPGQQSSAGQPAPSTLAEAAKKLAAGMSRMREPPTPAANADVGMATESQMANVNPQPPVPVRVLDVERLDSQWGDLREQSSDEMIETRRDALSPQVRKQVEAYFRTLSERSQKAEAK